MVWGFNVSGMRFRVLKEFGALFPFWKNLL